MFESLNVGSAVHKMTVLHDIINDCQLDLIVLQETRITEDSPLAIKLDIAPDDYSVLYVHRDSAMSTGNSRGGGLAVIFRNSVVVHQHSLPNAVTLTSFEFQLVRVGFKHSSSILINIYHSPSSSLATFYDELSDLISIVGSGITDCIVLCDNFSCPGVNDSHTDKELEIVLDTFNLTQHISSPTHGDSLLDIIVCEDATSTWNIRLDEAGLISYY